ncbi:MAG: glutaminyl-peptide cyclotransferase [Acidobacteria bacterium]|nr:glutaminyl-peptide cyclotransferase [Acidobacteriota bacterium]
MGNRLLRRRARVFCFLGVLAAGVAATGLAAGGGVAAQGGVPRYGYRVVNSYPHDSRAFTQGLIVRDGYFYESTGQHGQSTIRKVRIATGEVVQQRQLEPKYFGEGLTDWGSQLVQLTWKNNVGFVYDLASFRPVKTFAFAGEGWGLTRSRTHLIMSDGQPSGQLRFLDPASLAEVRRITVRDQGRPVDRLNELEFVRGEVFANVWYTDEICRIDPATGRVTGWIDLSGLLPAAQRAGSDAVLNGIAYDAAADRLFVTGKYWPRVFEIALERRR